jgi:hypothetical protein
MGCILLLCYAAVGSAARCSPFQFVVRGVWSVRAQGRFHWGVQVMGSIRWNSVRERAAQSRGAVRRSAIQSQGDTRGFMGLCAWTRGAVARCGAAQRNTIARRHTRFRGTLCVDARRSRAVRCGTVQSSPFQVPHCELVARRGATRCRTEQPVPGATLCASRGAARRIGWQATPPSVANARARNRRVPLEVNKDRPVGRVQRVGDSAVGGVTGDRQ